MAHEPPLGAVAFARNEHPPTGARHDVPLAPSSSSAGRVLIPSSSSAGRVLPALCLLAAPAMAQAAPVSLELLGSFEIPSGTLFEGTLFGGISGLDRAPDGTFYALSDDRGGEGRAPRFYRLAIDVDEGGIADVEIEGVTELRRPDGTPFPSGAPTVDPEGIRVAPNGNLYVSSEGNFSDDPEALFQPFLRELTPEGAFVRELSLPAVYDYADGETDGARDNALLEALAVAPDGTIYVGNEGPLIPDGAPSTATEGSVVRITAIDPATGEPEAQHAYPLPPIPLDGAAGAPGLSELLAFDEGSFLALERSFAPEIGNTVQITYAEIEPGTTDVLGVPALEGASYEPMAREVLVQVTDPFMGVDNDNLEALAFGPTLANGNRTLIAAADDNFNAFGNQRNLFVAFEIVPAPIPVPGALPLLAAGLAGLAFLRRRR